MPILKFLSLTLFFTINLLYANDVAYTFHLSKSNPYEKEAVLLEVNVSQVDPSKVMLFQFSLKKSTDYEFHQVSFKEHEKYHDLHQAYLYLIYPKKSGHVLLEFEMTKSITNDAKVAYAISGDRDSVKKLQKKDIKVEVAPLSLEVKSIPKGTDLVGDFTLTEKLDKQSTEAYDPVNLKVVLKGKGYLAPFKLIKKSKNYKLFTQNPKFKNLHTKVGSSSSLEWDYAISAKKNFEIEKRVLKAFNPLSQKAYELVLPSYKVKVQQVDESSLLDKKDYPAKSQGIDWHFWSWIFSYVVVFVAGLLMPRDIFKAKKLVQESSEEILKSKISSAKTAKALLEVLLLENDKRFSKSIEALEGVVYNGEKKSLSSIKKELEFGI